MFDINKIIGDYKHQQLHETALSLLPMVYQDENHKKDARLRGLKTFGQYDKHMVDSAISIARIFLRAMDAIKDRPGPE